VMSTRARRQRAHMLAGFGCIATPHIQHSTVPTVAVGTNIPASAGAGSDPGIIPGFLDWISGNRGGRRKNARAVRNRELEGRFLLGFCRCRVTKARTGEPDRLMNGSGKCARPSGIQPLWHRSVEPNQKARKTGFSGRKNSVRHQNGLVQNWCWVTSNLIKITVRLDLFQSLMARNCYWTSTV
jgi:hypothetical protein